MGGVEVPQVLRVWGGGIPRPTTGRVCVGGCAPSPENFSFFVVENTIF